MPVGQRVWCCNGYNWSASGFTNQYQVKKLVYYDVTEDMHSAIAREKQIKGWKYWRKLSLIEKNNPEWKDLSGGLGQVGQVVEGWEFSPQNLSGGRLGIKLSHEWT